MHRLLRLLTLWLIALALPIQGAAAATGMAMPASHARTPHHHAMGHDMSAMAGMSMATSGSPRHAEPCAHHATAHATAHAMDKSGCCGACCGPVACQPPTLAIAPAAETWAPAARATALVVAPQFFTDGPDRPPRAFLA